MITMTVQQLKNALSPLDGELPVVIDDLYEDLFCIDYVQSVGNDDEYEVVCADTLQVVRLVATRYER